MKMNLNKIFSILLQVVGIAVSFWIPLIGFLLWFVTQKSNPKTARYYLIAAVVGFVVNYILTFL